MKGKKSGPCLLSRCLALLMAVLLTAALTAALIGAVAVRGMTSEDLHVKAAVSDDAIAEQMDQISVYIGKLAEDYGFSAREVFSAVSSDELRKLNREMAVWWTRMITDGVMEDMPEWSSAEVKDAVLRSLDGDLIPVGMTREDTAAEVNALIQKRIREVSMPVRKTLLQAGFRYVRKKVDPAEAVRFASQGTVIAGVMSLALAGLIALLTGKRIRLSLRYLGAGLAGAGIASLFCGLLIRSGGIQSMIREVSSGMSVQTGYIFRAITTEAGIGAGILLAVGIVCLIADIRRPVSA